MNVKTWYTDQSARRLHAVLSEELAVIISRLCPGHELSHCGIHRNEETNEIQLRLHLNPIGRIRVASDPLRLSGVQPAGCDGGWCGS
jgi:hypothetical protein